MQGVTIAQLFRLQRDSSRSSSRVGFYDVGIPLSSTYHGVSILVALLGAYRFWKQQGAMIWGNKIYSGGWELNCVGMLISLVSTSMMRTVVVDAHF